MKSKSSNDGRQTATPDIDALQRKWMNDEKWRTIILPYVTTALYTSSSPFLESRQRSDAFLGTVQDAFEVAFPNVEYQFKPSDEVVVEVCQHVFLIWLWSGANVYCCITCVAMRTDAYPQVSHRKHHPQTSQGPVRGTCLY